MVRDLSVLVPARNEMFLLKTIQEVLAQARANTEVIVILDGAPPIDPIPQEPRVKIVYHGTSIGQRAATNEAARLSSAKYIMKLDAHCALDEGFDVKLMADCAPDWTVIPRMYNLHVFDWVCKKCKHRTYQGPTPVVCTQCQASKSCEREMVWKPRLNRVSDFMRFDSTLHFQYWGEYKKRPEAQGDIADTMCSLGACWFMERERYLALGGLDESHGSWGQVGVEMSCKSWLSGGRQVVNKKTWFSHMFRTSGGDFGFPYTLSGSAVQQARTYSRDLWFDNRWSGQIRPLFWLLEKFSPLPDWHSGNGSAALTRASQAADAFCIIRSQPSTVTNHTSSMTISADRGQFMSLTAVSPSSTLSGNSGAAQDVSLVSSQLQMDGVAASTPVTHMIDNQNIFAVPSGERADEPHPHNAVDAITDLVDPNIAVSAIKTSSPDPTAGGLVNSDLRKQPSDIVASQSRQFDHIGHGASKGLVYYTDARLDKSIALATQRQLTSAMNGHRLVSVSLKPIDFGEVKIVLPLERGYLTMFKQILAGLEALDTDYAFLVEHDVLYDSTHFDFTPPRRDIYYYNVNTWKLNVETGQAVSYLTKQTSGLCADRQLLIDHYRTRIALVEAHGFSRRMGFEPGSHARKERVDNVPSDIWCSVKPNIDLRHGQNLTSSRWKQSEFRDQRNCQQWVEATEIPGWGPVQSVIGPLRRVDNG